MDQNNPYDTPEFGMPSIGSSSGYRTVRLKRIDPISSGTMMGIFYGIGGLIAGAFIALLSVLGVAMDGGNGEAAIGGVFALVGLPILYGGMGFIAGVIGALLYNLVAAIVGGVQMDFDG
ncbi:MAG: hypothetical protein AAGF97_09865 [Planctomycetota bacterium]